MPKDNLKDKGFVNAEDIVGKRNPRYDEDNVVAETSELVFGVKSKITLGGSSEGPGNYGQATVAFLKKGLEKIK